MGAGRPGLGELERLAVRSCWERVKDVFLEGSNLDGMPDDTMARKTRKQVLRTLGQINRGQRGSVPIDLEGCVSSLTQISATSFCQLMVCLIIHTITRHREIMRA
jgi:hypothetical protein